MKKLKQVQQTCHTGKCKIEWVNIFACLLLLPFNGLDLYLKGYSLLDYVFYFLPFLIYPIAHLLFRKKAITTGLYFIVGFLTIALDNDILGMSGIIYLYFSYNEVKTHRYAIFIMVSSYVSLLCRVYILNTRGSDSVTSVILLTFILATFYFKVIKSSLSNKIDISKRDKEVIKLYSQGFSYDEINYKLKLNVKNESIRKIIKRVRDESGCNNDIQFGKWLYDNT